MLLTINKVAQHYSGIYKLIELNLGPDSSRNLKVWVFSG